MALLLGVVAIPVSAAFGSEMRWESMISAEERRSTSRPMVGHTLADAPPLSQAVPGVIEARVAAAWTDRRGSERRTMVAVPYGTEAGAEIDVWVDGSDDVVPAPLPAEHIAARAVTPASPRYSSPG